MWQKIIQNLIIFVYLFCSNNNTIDFRKTFITQEWSVVENSPTPCWIAMLYRLVYNICSHFNELGLNFLLQTPMDLFSCLYCYLSTYFTPYSSVSIVNLEHLIAGWIPAFQIWWPQSLPNEVKLSLKSTWPDNADVIRILYVSVTLIG